MKLNHVPPQPAPHRRHHRPAARPADVTAARDSFEMSNYQGLGVSPQELKKGAAVVKAALTGLDQPRVFVNRSLDSALELLRQGGRFSTIYDTVKRPGLDAESREGIECYLEGRRAHEERLGTHGQGEQAGQTVYGSLGFSRELSPELWSDGFLSAARELRQPRSRHLNTGIELTDGAVTFVLKPEVNQRATFLPSDTYDNYGERPVAVEHLAHAIWANIGSKGDSYFNSMNSGVLLELDRPQAVHGVQRFLTSDAINRGYMEAQVRGATLEDVERIVIRRHHASHGVADAAELEAGIRELQALAEQRGIPYDIDRSKPN